MPEYQRILAVKLDLNLRDPDDKAVWKRLLDLSWQAMQYGNNHLRGVWAEAAGLRMGTDASVPHDITKHIRRFEKGELSGAAYSAVEREARGLWQRHGKRVLAGAPLPEFREGKSLSIRGHKNLNESGVRLTFESGRFIAHLQAQAATCEGGSWLRIPIAANTATDSYQADILHAMAAWSTAISKATVTLHRERGRAILRLTYAKTIDLPEMGSRVATLGPLTRHGDRLLLRTELETKDYSDRLARIISRMSDWDKIRRRAFTQIGRRKGHAKIKRRYMARISTEQWVKTYLEQWASELLTWTETQGVGKLVVLPIGNATWPAYQFMQILKTGSENRGIAFEDETGASLEDAATARSAKQNATRERRRAKKLQDSVREIAHQFS